MPAIETRTDGCDIREATPEEGAELFDRKARVLLGMSGQEFLAAWDRGDFMEAEDPNVNSVAALIPFAR